MKTNPCRIFLLLLAVFSFQPGKAQNDGLIRTTDGLAITYKSRFIADCKKMYGFRTGDTLVSKACECQANGLNNYITTHQLSFYQKRYKEKALLALIEQDISVQRRINNCITPAGLLQLVSTSFSNTATKEAGTKPIRMNPETVK